MKNRSKVTINSPFGETENFEIEETVKHGKAYGPAICCAATARLNDIGEKVCCNHKEKKQIRLQIQNKIHDDLLSLGFPCCFENDNNTSACTQHFCDKNVSYIFILAREDWVTKFICKKLYGGRKVYPYYTYLCMYWYSKKDLSGSY